MGRYIQVEENVKIYVEDIGEGTPVIFLHGWPANHKMFEYQFSRLPANGYRCIGIDFRGFGKSDAPWESYSYDRLADDVRTVIDELGVTGATLFGFSMGGAVAIRYMARHNGHGIKSLVLAGAAAPVFTKRDDFDYGMNPEEFTEQMIVAAFEDRPKMLTKLGLQFTKTKTKAGMMIWLQSLCLQASHHGTVKAALSLREEDLRSDLSKIKVPTVIFHGAKDKICEPNLAKLTSEAIAGSRLIMFEESGHAMMFDEQAKFNEELLLFLNTEDLLHRGEDIEHENAVSK